MSVIARLPYHVDFWRYINRKSEQMLADSTEAGSQHELTLGERETQVGAHTLLIPRKSSVLP